MSLALLDFYEVLKESMGDEKAKKAVESLEKHLMEIKEEQASKENVVELKEEIKLTRKYLDEKIEVFKRESDKRIDLLQHNMDKRFELLQNNMEKRFEEMEKRFEDINKRFEDMNRKFNMMMWFIGILVSISIAITKFV